jgi:hypothetical protein
MAESGASTVMLKGIFEQLVMMIGRSAPPLAASYRVHSAC